MEISATRRGNTWEYEECEEYEGCFSRDARTLELRSANVLGGTNGAEVLGYRYGVDPHPAPDSDPHRISRGGWQWRDWIWRKDSLAHLRRTMVDRIPHQL